MACPLFYVVSLLNITPQTSLSGSPSSICPLACIYKKSPVNPAAAYQAMLYDNVTFDYMWFLPSFKKHQPTDRKEKGTSHFNPASQCIKILLSSWWKPCFSFLKKKNKILIAHEEKNLSQVTLTTNQHKKKIKDWVETYWGAPKRPSSKLDQINSLSYV